MQQVIQNIRNGRTLVREIPPPVCLPGHLLVAEVASLISVGTERYVVELARKNLLGKLLDRPDQARRLLQKVRQEGFLSTFGQAQAKLDEPMTLGYSAAGIVLECGAGVSRFKPGDRVAAAGCHAGILCIGENLCARIPDGVAFDEAAYAGVASIGLEGVRLAHPELGHRVLVIGLGLIGQIVVALLKAQGCSVFATDIDVNRLELARSFGADQVALGSPLDTVRAFSDGFGVDSAIITAATQSNGPMEFAAEACRSKGRIVLVGVAGLDISREPFFKKELEFTVSSSLGAGRGDARYEEKGIDYPIGYARWTAQRNMEAALATMAAGKLPVGRLTTHRCPIERASEAYDLITARKEPHLGVVLEYPRETAPGVRQMSRRIELKNATSRTAGTLGVSLIGAGNYARLIMMPALAGAPGVSWRGLCSARGVNAEHSGRKLGFQFATTDAQEIWSDRDTDAAFVATRHDLHADLAIAGLRAGKHVFLEKPLCITFDELERIDAAVRELGDACPLLMVGFNRRFAAGTRAMRGFFEGVAPVTVAYRFSPGAIPADHWTQDEAIGGGRIVGEACHAIDTCVALTGGMPLKVYAESIGRTGGVETTDDQVFIVIRHDNGCISQISYQAGGDRALPPERIEMFGGGQSAVNQSWDKIELWRGNKCRKLRSGKDKGHAAGFAAFLRACREGGAWPIPWSEMYGVTWASLMAVRSLREGTPFRCPEE
jgi:predicted dehydrogenase/threonine dehydrogenase-like Zn-dependent dehydrogenase